MELREEEVEVELRVVDEVEVVDVGPAMIESEAAEPTTIGPVVLEALADADPDAEGRSASFAAGSKMLFATLVPKRPASWARKRESGETNAWGEM